MMILKWQSAVAVCAVLVTLLFVVAEVEARRGGGRGGGGGGGRSFSRSGPASGGSVRSHQAPSGQRSGSMGNRQGNRNDMQGNRNEQRGNRNEQRRDVNEDRRDHRDDVRDDHRDYRDDVRDDRRDWYDDRYRRRVGSVLTVSAFRSLSCTTTRIHVNGIDYYRCDSAWYSRAYSGGSVTYVIVTAPAGY